MKILYSCGIEWNFFLIVQSQRGFKNIQGKYVKNSEFSNEKFYDQSSSTILKSRHHRYCFRLFSREHVHILIGKYLAFYLCL